MAAPTPPDDRPPAPEAGVPLPAGLLLAIGRFPPAVLALPARDLRIGRSPECDVPIPDDDAGVSRFHARLDWRGDHFELRDDGSSFGTFLNDRPLGRADAAPVAPGDRLRFGSAGFVFGRLETGPAPGGAGEGDAMLRGLASLDPGEVVRRALELLKRFSGVERACLVGAGTDPRLESLLTPLADPSLELSRSIVNEALATGRTASRFVPMGEVAYPTPSAARLKLRRMWAHPVTDREGRALAAVYLDSPNAGSAFPPEVEARLVMLAGHIGLALRNAALYEELAELNRTLEARVAERTKALEASQAQLVARDRLATLGRLVAAIAHELNNPVGAIASFAGTLRELLAPVLAIPHRLERSYADAAVRARAEALLAAALEASAGPPADSGTRLARERAIADWLAGRGIAAGPEVAARFARIGFAPPALEPALAPLRADGDALAAMAADLHGFGRALESIRYCGDGVARIVDGLKTYAHLDRDEAEVLDLHRGIAATLAVLQPRVPAGVEVVTRFAELPPLRHRPGALTQVWTNLVDNALRAMGERGRLTIETRREDGDAVVEVTDTGAGLPEAIRERIFELDATTRGAGAGLGLGLPICRSIVEKDHHGRIEFESRPGRTVFRVRLPLEGATGVEGGGRS